MKKVSVALTHYNHQEYLGEAVQSLVDQTVPPYELLLIDDGSKAPVQLDRLPPYTTVIMAPHRGVGAALNAAVSLMRGDVLCWLPADDRWMPNKLERQQQFAKQHPSCVLHSYCKIKQDDGFIRDGTVPELTDEEMRCTIRTSSPYFATTFWIPKSALRIVGPFREDVPACEDYEWVLRSVVLHGVCYRLQKESLAMKRIHANTLTSRNATQITSLMKQFNREIQ